MNDIIVVIPAYEPDDSLIGLIERLGADFDRFIVVDDGSKTADATFERVAGMPGVTSSSMERPTGISIFFSDEKRKERDATRRLRNMVRKCQRAAL